ncbi:hypothetical protein AB0H17_06385 [Streptomyces olivoreticuli]
MDEVELIDESGNCALVHRTSRRFPGLLIQGDTLHSLGRVAAALLGELESGDTEDARYSAMELKEAFDDFTSAYERMMTEARLPLPYSSEAGKDR